VERFTAEHEALYGYAYHDDPRHPVEWVNLRVSGIGPITRPELARLDEGDGDPSQAVTGSREVFFSTWVETPTLWRGDLEAGDVVTGPAIIEEFGSTIPVHPGFTARVDALANVIVTKDA
jgi:N-methylhydantoinase A